MNETSSRLLELLALLQGRRDWPGAELAERLGVSGRTIRRDVERLRELGYPVESLTGPAGMLGLDTVDEHDGVRTVRFPATLSRTPATTRRRPPGLDEHGGDLRGWLSRG